MTQTETKIIDRIKKLMRLAESSNVNEAAAAAAQAQRLIEEHRIDQAVLFVEDDPIEAEDIDDGTVLQKGAKLAVWKSTLAGSLCLSNACRAYIERDRRRRVSRLHIAGRPSDVATVVCMFTYLCDEIDRLRKLEGGGRGRTWANNFRLGAVITIRQRLMDARNQARATARNRVEGDSAALVRLEQALAQVDARAAEVNRWMEENVGKLRKEKASSRYDRGAYQAGKRAGASINLGDNNRPSLPGAQRALEAGEG